ncbi:MAG: hypothetical protein LIP08_12345 [Bacteroides sp.]|nr:hypothetical protein [Bacteroides sp.]
MNKYHKYGITATIGLIVTIIILCLVIAPIKGRPYTYIFDDGTGGIAMCFFILLWSAIAYYIGYGATKRFDLKKEYYKTQVPLVDEKIFNKLFIDHYISQSARMFSIVFVTAIPWYALGYIREDITEKDLWIMGGFAVLSLICFLIFIIKKNQIEEV